MLDIYQRLPAAEVELVDDGLTLDHSQREKGRFKAVADSGQEVRVFLERGKTLEVGEMLRSECGVSLKINAAVEEVARASTDDWFLFSRACYHLGNRHVKLQVGECWLYIKPDYVLEDMLKHLGLDVSYENAAFIPEPGAYFGRGQHEHHHH